MIRETASIILAALDVLAIWVAVLFILLVAWVTACEWNVHRTRRRNARVWKRIEAETTDLRRELDEAEWTDAVRVFHAKDRVR